MLTVVDTVVLLVVGSAVDDSRDEIMVSYLSIKLTRDACQYDRKTGFYRLTTKDALR